MTYGTKLFMTYGTKLFMTYGTKLFMTYGTKLFSFLFLRGRHDRDLRIVGFTTIYAISAYHR